MEQDILMWISVIAAFGYTFYSFVKIIWNTLQEKRVGCTSGCGSCSAKTDLLKHVHFKTTVKNNASFKMMSKNQ